MSKDKNDPETKSTGKPRNAGTGNAGTTTPTTKPKYDDPKDPLKVKKTKK